MVLTMVKRRSSDNEGEINVEEVFADEVNSLKSAVEKQKSRRVYSTGFLMLDCGIGETDPIKGNKGVPERTIMEVFGRTSSLKTGTYEQLTKNILKDDPENRVVILYAEETDLDRWSSIGVTPEEQSRIYVLGCSEGEDVMLHLAEKNLDRIKLAVQDPRVKLVVIDSIKGLCLAKQLYGKKGEVTSLEDSEQLALRAKLIGEFLRDFKELNKRSILYMANQTSDRIMLSPMDLIVNPQFTVHTPGGRAKEFECQIRIQNETRPIYTEQEHELTGKKILIGWELSCRLIKNKFCRTSGNRVAVSNFYFSPPGFNKAEDVLYLGEYLTRFGIIDEVKKGGAGSWSIGGEKVRGELAAKQLLANKPDLLYNIEKKILENSEMLFNHLKKTNTEEDILF